MLVEQHTITAGTTDEARELARRWAESHGLELRDVAVFLHSDGDTGVSFDVTVGKGDLDLDDPRRDRWTWSARMLHWRRVFSNGDGREGRRIVAREDAERAVARMPRRSPVDGPVPAAPLPEDQSPPWLRRADGWDEDDQPVGEGNPMEFGSAYFREAQRKREQALLGTVQPTELYAPDVEEVAREGDERVFRSERRARCGECYCIGAHSGRCSKR